MPGKDEGDLAVIGRLTGDHASPRLGCLQRAEAVKSGNRKIQAKAADQRLRLSADLGAAPRKSAMNRVVDPDGAARGQGSNDHLLAEPRGQMQS